MDKRRASIEDCEDMLRQLDGIESCHSGVGRSTSLRCQTGEMRKFVETCLAMLRAEEQSVVSDYAEPDDTYYEHGQWTEEELRGSALARRSKNISALITFGTAVDEDGELSVFFTAHPDRGVLPANAARMYGEYLIRLADYCDDRNSE